ncbi:MAG: hypothetical protein WEB79_08470 [Thermoleophilaceae bacterium]
MLAYLDPGSGSDPGLTVLATVLIVLAALLLLGATIYVAVRLARRD